MNSYPNIAIVGPSGYGKSTSFRNCNPESTAIINIEKKTLPFPSAAKFINCVEVGNYSDSLAKLMEFGSKPAIELIILESFTTLDERWTQLCRNTEKGYDVWNKHNKELRDFITASKSIKNKYVVFTAIDEVVSIQSVEGGNTSVKRIKVAGKELEGTIDKEFTIVLYSEIQKVGGLITYKFRTNTDGVCSAKTPMGMYDPKTEILIDNDLNAVIQRIKKYYQTP